MSSRLRAVVALVLVLLLAVGGSVALAMQGGGDDEPSADPTSSTEPDLSGVPDVVATVDGFDISKKDFEQAYTAQFQIAATQAQTSGTPVDQDALRKQTVETMVDTQLLTAEAEDRDYDVSAKDVDAALSDLAEQNQLAGPDELVAALVEQGLTEEQVDEQVEQQVRIDRLLDEESDAEPASEADLKKVYDQVVAEQGEGADLPTFEEARPQLEQQAEQEDKNAVAQQIVTELRKDAKIEILL